MTDEDSFVVLMILRFEFTITSALSGRFLCFPKVSTGFCSGLDDFPFLLFFGFSASFSLLFFSFLATDG